jgi:alpha-glucosidase
MGNRAGTGFRLDLLPYAYPYDARGQTVWHYLQRRPGEHYYGFGEKAGPLDKHGLRLRMCNTDALGYDAESGDPLYKHWPFYITYVPELKLAYGLFYDNLAATTFELGKEVNGLWGQYRYYEAAGGDLDYYLIYGPTIPAVIEKFTRLTGRPLLPPRWSLGYLGSTMAYTERPDAQAALDEFITHCEEHAIPCDGFHLSSGYTTDPQGRRQVFTWNTSRIPEPARMVDASTGRASTSPPTSSPTCFRSHPRFEEVRARGGFIQAADGLGPEMGERWSAESPRASRPPTSTSPTRPGMTGGCSQPRRPCWTMESTPLWNDNNEFEVWTTRRSAPDSANPSRPGWPARCIPC